LSDSFACVKWGNSWSHTFKISSGFTQGSVLSIYGYADIGHLQNNRIGTFIILYADDILLLARSVTALQKLLWACDLEFESMDMSHLLAELTYGGSNIVAFISVKYNSELQFLNCIIFCHPFRNARMFSKWERWQLSR